MVVVVPAELRICRSEKAHGTHETDYLEMSNGRGNRRRDPTRAATARHVRVSAFELQL